MTQSQKYLQQLLLSRQGLLITAEGYASVIAEASPTVHDSDYAEKGHADMLYTEVISGALDLCSSQVRMAFPDKDISIVSDYTSEELPDNSIAYYPVFGVITSNSWWRFSSKQFEKDLLASESNPAIIAHFVHIDSPGGEAFYMDRLSETMRDLSKPVVVLAERVCASAGYLIACHGTRIFAATGYDKIGSIGTMAEVWDYSEYFKKIGIEVHTYHASASDLKTKLMDDAASGKGDEYVERLLNPLNDMFLSEVRSTRPALKDAPDDEPALRGDIYLTDEAIGKGLIDARATLTEAILEASRLGREYADIQRAKSQLLSII